MASQQTDPVKTACLALFSKFGKEVAINLFVCEKTFCIEERILSRFKLCIFSLGVCEDEAVQRRAAGILPNVCSVAAPQHHSSGH